MQYNTLTVSRTQPPASCVLQSDMAEGTNLTSQGEQLCGHIRYPYTHSQTHIHTYLQFTQRHSTDTLTCTHTETHIITKTHAYTKTPIPTHSCSQILRHTLSTGTYTLTCTQTHIPRILTHTDVHTHTCSDRLRHCHSRKQPILLKSNCG